MPALVFMIQKGIHIFRGPLCVQQHSVSVHRGFKMYSVFILLLSVIFILFEPAYPICYKRGNIYSTIEVNSARLYEIFPFRSVFHLPTVRIKRSF